MKAFKHIFQTLINSNDGVLAYAKQIFDTNLKKNQEEINKNKLDNPSGGKDGQVLTKKGDGVIWKTIDPKDQYIGEPGTGEHSEIFNDYINNKAEGDYSHVEGSDNIVDGLASHAEGYQTAALKDTAHSEGYKTSAISDAAHAEGFGTTASGQSSHAEGFGQELTAYDLIITKIAGQAVTVKSITTNIKPGFVYKISLNNKNLPYTYYIKSIESNVIIFDKTDGLSIGTYKIKQVNGVSHGEYSHVEGIRCVTTHTAAHAEGGETKATNWAAHAEGGETVASGYYSHAEGYKTIASVDHQHVQGRCNEELKDAADIIGWGMSESNRKNIEATKINGTKWLLLDVTCGGTYEEPTHKLSEKLNNPSGGSVGQVLTKTETGVEWKNISVPETEITWDISSLSGGDKEGTLTEEQLSTIGISIEQFEKLANHSINLTLIMGDKSQNISCTYRNIRYEYFDMDVSGALYSIVCILIPSVTIINILYISVAPDKSIRYSFMQ